MINNFNCTDVEEISLYENMNDCVNEIEVENYLDAYYKFFDSKYKECLLECPIECDKNRIVATQTFSKMYSIQNQSKLLQFFTLLLGKPKIFHRNFQV